MASKKKVPSFEIPDAVRDAGQSGWVYRTGEEPAKPRAQRRTTRSVPEAEPAQATTVKEATLLEGAAAIEGAAASNAPSEPVEPGMAPGAGMTGGLIGLGLQVVAVPLVVPLFLTAALSKLGRRSVGEGGRPGMTSES